MCEISKICPIFLSLNIKKPIVVKIKNGLELFVYAISRSASIGEINLFFFKLQTTFAPIGYPLIFPKIKAIDASPGTLKIGFIIGVKTLPNIDAIFVFNSNSVAIKNGNKEGKILTIQSSNPDFVAFSELSENKNNNIANKEKTIVKKYFLKLITINFIKPPIKMLYA